MKIAFVGQPEYFRFCYEDDLSNDYEIKEVIFNFGMQMEEFDDLCAFNPDITFFFRGEFVPALVLQRLNGLRVALSSEPFPRHIDSSLIFTKDSISRYIDFRKRIKNKPFDYIFHYDESSLAFMLSDGIKVSGAFALPVANFTYVPIENKKIWDIFFIGRSTLHREKFFGPIKHHFEFLHICHGVFGPPLLEYISRSKICLNVHAENEISWEPRVQMLLAAGAFVISEPLTPNNFLRAGIDYIEVKNKDDMYRAVEFYLIHEDERKAIANSGKSRVAELLSARRNFSILIGDLNESKYMKFETGRASRLISIIISLCNGIFGIRSVLNKVFK